MESRSKKKFAGNRMTIAHDGTFEGKRERDDLFFGARNFDAFRETLYGNFQSP